MIKSNATSRYVMFEKTSLLNFSVIEIVPNDGCYDYWYRNWIFERFKIISEDYDKYRVFVNNGVFNTYEYIFKIHCEIIK